MPQLRFLAGPSLTDLSPLEINSDIPLSIKSAGFEGQVAVYIKGLADSPEGRTHSPYFDHPDRKGITWSIQIQGVSSRVLLPKFIAKRFSRTVLANSLRRRHRLW
jgi:hypothetical protein